MAFFIILRIAYFIHPIISYLYQCYAFSSIYRFNLKLLPMAVNVSTTVIINNLGQVLMMLRDNNPEIAHPGYWGLIGGHAQEGENPKITAVREIYEETGIRAQENDLLLLTVIKTRDRIRHVFLLKGEWTDTDIVQGEGQIIRFQAIDNELPSPMSEEHQAILLLARKHLGMT